MSNKSTVLIRFIGPIVALFTATIGGFESHFILLGITFWMLIWWISETVHLAVTALLPLLLFPFFGIMEAKSMSTYYAHPLVYLFFGGFVIARALEQTNLHYRIALWILRKTGTEGRGLLAGFMLSTGFMSMWISNTATSIMMLPIVTSVLAVLPKNISVKVERPLLLSVAWAANIGGMATLIGTPPNMIFAGFLSENLDREIGFVEWLPIGLSASISMGIVAFLILARSFRGVEFSGATGEDTAGFLNSEWEKLGSLSRIQKRVALIFVTTALLWIVRPYLGVLSAHMHWSDTGISLIAALLLFTVIGEKGSAILDWEATSKLPWGILILFGGGLALAGTLQQSQWFGLLESSMQSLGEIPLLIWVLIMALLGVFATELLSNMALVSALMPLVFSLSITFGWSMEILSVPLVLGASCAFMLPMATPPNAIVFSTGKLTVRYMMVRGLLLNIAALLLLTILGYVLITMG